MTGKDRILTALGMQKPDRVPLIYSRHKLIRQDNRINLILNSCKSSNYPESPFLATAVSD